MVVASPTKVTDTTHAAPQESPSRVNISIKPLQECVVGTHLISYLNAKLLGADREKERVA